MDPLASRISSIALVSSSHDHSSPVLHESENVPPAANKPSRGLLSKYDPHSTTNNAAAAHRPSSTMTSSSSTAPSATVRLPVMKLAMGSAANSSNNNGASSSSTFPDQPRFPLAGLPPRPPSSVHQQSLARPSPPRALPRPVGTHRSPQQHGHKSSSSHHTHTAQGIHGPAHATHLRVLAATQAASAQAAAQRGVATSAGGRVDIGKYDGGFEADERERARDGRAGGDLDLDSVSKGEEQIATVR